MLTQNISTLLSISPLTPSNLSAPPQTAPVAATSSQCSSFRRMQHQLAPTPVLEPMGAYVGELQEKWQFPSDHLPIGMTFDHFHLVSWNVLNAEYMSWITEKKTQGLNRSMIADEHVYIGNSKLTLRDRHIVDLILQMTTHPTHPRSILSLQECSPPFLEELRSRLPSHFEVIVNEEEAMIVDRRLFKIVDAKKVGGIFKDAPHETIQDVTLLGPDHRFLRLINVHLPGDPAKPSRFEFAEYLARTFEPLVSTIVMGDMNFNELEMKEAMNQAFEWESPFSQYSPYCTNIQPSSLQSKAIDHFFVYSPLETAPNSSNEIIEGLDRFVSLLGN